MRKVLLGASLALSFVSSAATADIVGATAGIERWAHDWSGTLTEGSEKVDLKNDLGLDKDNGLVMYAAIEHPLPILPNVMVKTTSLKTSGNNALSRSFNYKGNAYALGKAIETEADLSHTDITAYYEILDNWVNLDVGITVRNIDGYVELTQEGNTSKEKVKGIVPMGFANARFNLPFSGFYAKAMGNVFSFSGDSATDYTVGVGYEAYLVSMEVGFREQAYSLDKSFLKSDISVEGPYISVNIDI